MNGVTDCVAKCDQGDGSAAATNAYAVCRNSCISSYIVLTGTNSPVASSTSAGQSGPKSASASASASGSGAKASGSGAASSASSKALAAPTAAARLGAAGGSLGLVFAAFALL